MRPRASESESKPVAGSKAALATDEKSVRETNGAQATVCVECGAVSRTGDERCWVCGSSRRQLASGRGPVRLPMKRPPSAQFRLDSMLLTTSLLAALLALARVSPVGALVSLALCTPPYLRTALWLTRDDPDARPLSTWGKFVLFVESILLFSLTLVAFGSSLALVSFGAHLLTQTIAWIWDANSWAAQSWLVIGWIIASMVGLWISIGLAAWIAGVTWPRRWLA